MLARGWGGQRRIQGVLRPRRREVAPVVVARPGAVEPGQEGVVAELGPEAGQFRGDDGIAQEHRRQWSAGFGGRHPLDVPAEDLLLHRPGVEEVDGHQQEPLAGQRRFVAVEGRMELALGPGGGMALQEQVEHSHEVRLAGAKAAVEVERLGRSRRHGAGDLAQGLVEGVGQLGGDLVAADRRLCRARTHALRELEDEVPITNLGGDVDELSDEGHQPPRPRMLIAATPLLPSRRQC